MTAPTPDDDLIALVEALSTRMDELEETNRIMADVLVRQQKELDYLFTTLRPGGSNQAISENLIEAYTRRTMNQMELNTGKKKDQ